MRKRELRGRGQSGNVDFDVVDPDLQVRLIHGEFVAVTSAVVVARDGVQVEAGASDLFRLNLREQQLTLAVLGQIEVTAGYFRALAQYRASLGGALP